MNVSSTFQQQIQLLFHSGVEEDASLEGVLAKEGATSGKGDASD